MVKPDSLRRRPRQARTSGTPRSIVVFVVAISTAFLSVRVFQSSNSTTNSLMDFIGTESNNGNADDYTIPPNPLDPASEMNARPAPDYHLVVSTGCSPYQNWQAYALFFHAIHSGQVTEKGSVSYVTRVVSGCNEEQAARMNEIHARDIAPMAPGRFFLHHTPTFQYVKPGLDYSFFNKPLGYKHWMENALRYPYNNEKYDNVTYILLDPDHILLRPFSNHMSDTSEIWGGPFRDKRLVERGQPFAQEYAFGIYFFAKMDMTKIAPKNELPSLVSSLQDSDKYSYMVGPPYIMKGYDLWRVISKWAEFVPHVYQQDPGHLSEMYAYSVAAAHLGLKHQVVHSFMVSNADVPTGEGWNHIDEKPAEDICNNLPKQDLPHVLHYCQEYGVGKYFFSKYTLPPDFLSCDSPLLREPPSNLATLYNYMINPRNQERRDFGDNNNNNNMLARRNAFAVCHMIRAMNQAAEHYKQNHCKNKLANYNRSLAFFADM